MKLIVTQDCECEYQAYWTEHIPVEEESIEVLKDKLEEAATTWKRNVNKADPYYKGVDITDLWIRIHGNQKNPLDKKREKFKGWGGSIVTYELNLPQIRTLEEWFEQESSN